jgi:Holliday junction resolvase-like predicted endonuclease
MDGAAAGAEKATHKKDRRGARARRLGAWAERATLWLLWLRGWDLVEWRKRIGRFEMDLLMCRGKDLRLVEVKARRRGAWVGADTALTSDQRLRLQMAMRAFLDQIPWPFDVTFQRVSWAGVRCWFHPPERWELLGQTGAGDGRGAETQGRAEGHGLFVD